jgi:hypothetical protein
MKLTGLLEDILWLQGCTRKVLTVNLSFKVQEVLNPVRSFISLLQVFKVLEIFAKSILLFGFGLRRKVRALFDFMKRLLEGKSISF